MLNFLGVSENLSVLADSRWVSTFLFTDEVTGEQAALDGVTFEGTVSVSEREEYALAFTRSSSDAQRHIVEVEVPPLPEGRWKYSIFVTHETGEKARLMYGYVTAVGAFIDTSGQSYANRTLEVKLPGDATKRIQLEWQASTVAQMAAKNALDAAERVADLQETAEDAVSKATEALGKLDKVEELVESAETAAGEAQEAANQAQEIVDAAPREYIPTIVGGYWYINGQNTGVKAEGEDGLDGARVTRHLVMSADEIPTSGDTCNSGHVYYVSQPTTLYNMEAQPTGQMEYNALRFPASKVPHGVLLSGLVIKGVLNSSTTALYAAVYLREGNTTKGLLGKSTEAKAWESGQDVEWDFEEPFEIPDGFAMEIYLVDSLEALGENSATAPSVLLRAWGVSGNVGACRARGNWIGGPMGYIGLKSPHGGEVMIYEWFDEIGWVHLADNATQSLRPASASVDGIVKLGSDQIMDGAPVGVNADGQMQVPIANAVRAGAVMLSESGVIDVGAPIGYDSSGRLVASAADVTGRKATLTQFGVIKLGSEWKEGLAIPYIVGIGATSDGRLSNNLLHQGALKHMQRGGWQGAGMSWTGNSTFLDETSYYLGLHTSESFTQSEARGLELRPATQARIGGVTLTGNPYEESSAHVLDAAATLRNYAPRPELADMLEAYIKTNTTLMEIKVLTQEEYDKLTSVKAHTLYLVY